MGPAGRVGSVVYAGDRLMSEGVGGAGFKDGRPVGWPVPHVGESARAANISQGVFGDIASVVIFAMCKMITGVNRQ